MFLARMYWHFDCVVGQPLWESHGQTVASFGGGPWPHFTWEFFLWETHLEVEKNHHGSRDRTFQLVWKGLRWD